MKFYFVLMSLLSFIKCKNVNLMVVGEVAEIRQFAHCAFLFVKCGKKTQGFICGTSIVNQRILLTAAHCVKVCSFQERKKGISMTVSVGHEHRDKGLVIKVNSTYPHEEYDNTYFANDIALIRLSKDLELGRDVRRVALMKRPPYFKMGQVAGWGLVKDAPIKKSKMLYYIDQYVWTPSKCRKTSQQLPEGTLCASSKKRGSYAAEGDSGSALMVRGYIQIGLVSYKVPDVSKSLVVYTDIGYYYDWITRTSKKLYCSKKL